MDDKDHVVMWLVGVIFLLILAIFMSPYLVEGAVLTGIKLGEVIEGSE